MRRLLVLLAAGWVAVTLAAARVAVDRKVGYDLAFFAEAGRAARVEEDWLYGWGTGFAGPMWLVAAVAVLTALSTLAGAAGRIGAFLVALLGGASIVYTLANRPATERLRTFESDPTVSWLLTATLALAGLLVLVGFTVWLTAPRDQWS